ncbi:MAG TPA: ABC transporter substrate-binding protein [Methylibium sp.]|uniref:ABC transporter substrate-binding protein n=1 Tax=Methylibium sp. TaxID=2067992 RepID=UPI002DB64E4A|nr:ABC transporter substrate-binding protein [Methylibium sp.]HEU4458628.1 ABC transporter substrate-binding protein [Methylibium sp.]
MVKRRELLGGAAGASLAAAVPWARAQAGTKRLRVTFRSAETGFDPARVNDIYSRQVCAHLFDGLYRYDYLARPIRIKPNVAAAMPEVSADFRVWTVTLRPGIFFTDDPAFKGGRRELVAADFVYALKRFFDPVTTSPTYGYWKKQGFVGLDALRDEALKNKTAFDYDRPVEGVKALDRYTLRFTVDEPRPRLLHALAGGDLFNGVAREVVEHYGDDIAAHPVGTGPFVLKDWRRSSRILLVRNPDFRDERYAAEPAADDTEGRALLARFKGRRLPMVDEVEIFVIEEGQPRWLSFLNGEVDLMDPVPPELATAAVPNGRLAPNLEKRGIGLHRIQNADVGFLYFNMDDPVVGGYTPEKVALRRAIGLAMDIEREVQLIRNGQAIRAQTSVPPGLYGYDPALRTVNGEFDPSRARALLDLYGYLDRDGDGWREQPDGAPLLLRKATQSDQVYRQLEELLQKNLAAVGLRIEFDIRQWPENLKAGRAGKLQMWSLATTAASPDGFDSLARYNSAEIGGQNFARFRHAGFDAIYRRMNLMPDGPERLALFKEAHKIALAYAPYKFHTHRIYADLTQPWLVGYRRPSLWLDLWQYLDIDHGAAKA